MKKNRGKGLSIVIAFILLIVSSNSYAQSPQVTGTVTEKLSGDPLPGVTVYEKGSTNGTVTNIDGQYSINTDVNSILVFSFVGFTPSEVAVAGKTVINVGLEADVISLEEIVAIGYGTVKKKDITGSVASISSEDLLLAPISSVDAGLKGKIAGVSIQQTTGAPGQKMKIRVRGGSSINFSNEPLYVIDGFIGADISTINPNDIASIDVLKDASATAIYGSRGSNGVILITTNAPKEGALKVSFEANAGTSSMINEYDILSAGDQAELINLQNASKGQPDAFTAEEVAGFKQNGGTNWSDLITRKATKQNYTVNLTGGSDKLKYFFSGNMLDDQGVIKESYYKRYSLRSNISAKISDRIDMKFNTYATHTDSQNNGRQNNGVANAYGRSVLYPQFWESKDADGEFIIPSTYNSYGGRYQPGQEANPEQFIMQNQETFGEKITSNLDLTFDLGHNFTLFISNAGSFSTGFNGKRDLINNVNIKRADITASQAYNRGSSYLNTDILSYENDFGKHHLKVSAVYEFSKNSYQSNETKVNDLATLANEWYILNNGKPSLSSSEYNETKMRSYMGRINYSFDDKYLVTVSMRADGASVFQEGNQWGYFPSAALAWRASEESFIQDIDWIYNMKVRAGYGVTGNRAIGAYDTQSTLDQRTNQPLYYYWDNQTPVAGVIPGELTNPALQWESTSQLNFGLDFSVLRGKLSATLDVYEKKSSDVIISRTTPAYLGLSGNSFTDNFADIENKGFEFSLNWNILNKKDLSWSANFNVSSNKNKVTDLGIDADHIFVASEEALGIWNIVGGNKFIVQEGKSMGSLYGLKALGLWQENEATAAAVYGAKPGEMRYEDLDDSGSYEGTDRQIIGNASPDFIYGFNTSLYYKNFDFSVQCVGQVGNDIYNYSKNVMNRDILYPGYLNRWSPSNSGSTQQIMPVGTDHSASYVVSQYVENGSFFKVSNLTIGYTLPANMLQQIGISNLRLYGSVTNLLTITDYSGLDPEASSSNINSDSQAGIDAFSYPLVRTFSAGLKVTF
ncbi:SusC/RagA family TonB-linked outer membrane protein [Labilibaculum antarcticum]|uniref:SusC/RagA family TonB-linked outer membrane protein n=1 Tax=Labilibaculum antarcticum TaxID=1717717 RepID=A0A1Y1CDN8_9BACT|nr:TonB-dependent receptor [Labilibaculum antarcticum]BAX78445.1 SusC/RagA family TonB-linked outer membrane protein [Labilibaculum antarcticum]